MTGTTRCTGRTGRRSRRGPGAHLTSCRATPGPLPGRSHYFKGQDRVHWTEGLPRHRKLAYGEVYSGIDAVFCGGLDHLGYDLVMAPGTDPGRIQIEFDGVEGIALDESGNLVPHLPDDLRLVQPAPASTKDRQEIQGAQRPVGGDYAVP